MISSLQWEWEGEVISPVLPIIDIKPTKNRVLRHLVRKQGHGAALVLREERTQNEGELQQHKKKPE